MIAAHQPTIFDTSVIAALSSVSDGNMKFGIGMADDVVKNRESFLASVGIHPDDATLVGITYATNDFAKYRTVSAKDKAKGIIFADQDSEPVDALAVSVPNHALLLPLADCVGAILHDPVRGVLMVSHLGRHSVEVHGATKSVAYLVSEFKSNPADIRVWLSPGVGKESYPLHAFDGSGLHEIIIEQLASAGITKDRIERSPIDTAMHDDYYSHSQFLQNNEKVAGRFAIVAMMTEQGEPAS